MMGSGWGEGWRGGCWRGSHPAGRVLALGSQGPGGGKVSQPCQSTKPCPSPLQPQLPLVEIPLVESKTQTWGEGGERVHFLDSSANITVILC